VSTGVGLQPAIKPVVSYTRTQINRSMVQGFSLGHSRSASREICRRSWDKSVDQAPVYFPEIDSRLPKGGRRSRLKTHVTSSDHGWQIQFIKFHQHLIFNLDRTSYHLEK
jgi:hypothetical protein